MLSNGSLNQTKDEYYSQELFVSRGTKATGTWRHIKLTPVENCPLDMIDKQSGDLNLSKRFDREQNDTGLVGSKD